MRALLALPLVAACQGVHGDAPDGPLGPISVNAEWTLHDAATALPLLCNADETVTVTVGSVPATTTCAGTSPNIDGTLNQVMVSGAPRGLQIWSAELRGGAGDLRAQAGGSVEIGEDDPQLPMIDLRPMASGSTGGLAVSWEIVSAGGTQVCSGALREALEIDVGASVYSVHAADWKAASQLDVPFSPGVGVEPYAAIDTGVRAGATSATVRLVNTQDGSTEVSTNITTTVVAGRTVIVPKLDLVHCP